DPESLSHLSRYASSLVRPPKGTRPFPVSVTRYSSRNAWTVPANLLAAVASPIRNKTSRPALILLKTDVPGPNPSVQLSFLMRRQNLSRDRSELIRQCPQTNY